MKPTTDLETLEHIQTIFEFADGIEWTQEYDDRYRQSYIACPSCSATYWSNGESHRDKNGHNPYHEPEHREHGSGCRLEASLKFMRAFLRVEDQLHREAEDSEAA